MNTLRFVPGREFNRIRECSCPINTRSDLLADMTRLNALAAWRRGQRRGHPELLNMAAILSDLVQSDLELAERAPEEIGGDTIVVDEELRSILLAALSGYPDLSGRFLDDDPGVPLPRNLVVEPADRLLAVAQGMAHARELAGSRGRVIAVVGKSPRVARTLANMAESCPPNLLVITRTDPTAERNILATSLARTCRNLGWQTWSCRYSDHAILAEILRLHGQGERRPGVVVLESEPDDDGLELSELVEHTLDRLDVTMCRNDIDPLELSECEIDPAKTILQAPPTHAELTDTLRRVLDDHPQVMIIPESGRPSALVAPLRRRSPGQVLDLGRWGEDLMGIARGLRRESRLPLLIQEGSGESKLVVRVPGLSAAGGEPVRMLPCNEEEVAAALDYVVAGHAGSIEIEIAASMSERVTRLPRDYRLAEGRGAVLSSGSDALLLATGPEGVDLAQRTAQILVERGHHLTVVAMPWLNRLDSRWLKPLLSGFRRLFVLEDSVSARKLTGELLTSCSQCDLLQGQVFRAVRIESAAEEGAESMAAGILEAAIRDRRRTGSHPGRRRSPARGTKRVSVPEAIA